MSNRRLRHRQLLKQPRKKTFLRDLPIYLLGIVAFYVAIHYPEKPISPLDKPRVFSEGVRIELDRTSPAFAAMEDVLLGKDLTEYESTSSLNLSGQVEMLEAGSHSAVSLAEMLVRDNAREATLMAQARAAREANARLMAQAAAEAFQRVAAALATQQKLALSKQKITDVKSDKSANLRARSDDAQNSSASQGSTHKLAQAEYTHPTRTIRLADIGMSRDELAKVILMPLATADLGDEPSIRTMIAGRASINAVSGRGTQPRLGGFNPARWPASARENIPGTRQNFENASGRNFFDSAPKQDPSSIRPFGVESQNQNFVEPVHQLVIGGPIEFAGGLALTNNTDRVVVYRETDGQMMESGAVWLKEGRYEIFVETAKGTLLAELRTPHGDILGRGSFELENLPLANRSQYKVDSLPIKIKPVPVGVTGQVLATQLLGGKNVPVAGAQLQFENLPFSAVSLKDGRFEEPNLLEGTVTLITTSLKSHWNTLGFGASGLENSFPIFSNSKMSLFAKAVAPPQLEVDKFGLILGRVTNNGNPVSGAEVELLTENDVVKPVYFNEMLMPDKTLSSTSSAGYYAFFPVKKGTHAIQAKVGDYSSELALLPVEARTVSTMDLEMQSLKKATVRVFDAFRTDWPLRAEISQPGQRAAGQDIDQSGEGQIRYAPGANLLILDTDTGGTYETVRVSFARDRRFIYIPMVQKTWLEKIRSSMRENATPNTGHIVGFIQGNAPYQVSLDDESTLPTSRIVYFDSHGQLTGKDFGEPGGGFILLNIPEGFRSVLIQPRGSEKSFAATVLVDSKVTNIINHWIR